MSVTRGEFAQLALERVRAARPGFEVVLDEENFHVKATGPDGDATLTSLANFYEEYLHAPEQDRERILDRVTKVSGMIDGQESLDEVRVLLRPRIRTRRHFEIDSVVAARSLPGAKHTRCHYRPLATHLGVAVAIDRPEHIAYVMDPSRYGVPASELEEIAAINLKRMKTEPLKPVGPGAWIGLWGDDYAAERMLLPGLFDDLELEGEPVVFLPGSEVMLVVGTRDYEAQRIVLALVEKRMAEPRSLVDFAFVKKGGEWIPFEPTFPEDVAKVLEVRLLQYLGSAYAAQKDMLEAQNEGDEEAPFVATLFGVEQPNGEPASMTTWAPDVHAWLPRADIVATGAFDRKEPLVVTWQNLMDVCGDLLTPVPDVWPPRWEVRKYPDAATLARLEARAEKGKADAQAAQPSKPARRFHPATFLAVAVVAYVLYRLLS